MNKMQNRLARVAGLAAAGVMFVSSAAHAAIDPAVTTAISDGTADGKTVAYALLAFAVAVGVVMYIKRKAG